MKRKLSVALTIVLLILSIGSGALAEQSDSWSKLFTDIYVPFVEHTAPITYDEAEIFANDLGFMTRRVDENEAYRGIFIYENADKTGDWVDLTWINNKFSSVIYFRPTDNCATTSFRRETNSYYCGKEDNLKRVDSIEAQAAYLFGSPSFLTSFSKTTTVPVGEYIVGQHIPAGEYAITCEPDTYAMQIRVYRTDTRERLVLSEVLRGEEGNKIGRLELLDGDKVKVSTGPAVFSVFEGLGF